MAGVLLPTRKDCPKKSDYPRGSCAVTVHSEQRHNKVVPSTDHASGSKCSRPEHGNMHGFSRGKRSEEVTRVGRSWQIVSVVLNEEIATSILTSTTTATTRHHTVPMLAVSGEALGVRNENTR